VRLPVDDRPVVIALAGPNGAGKTTFYHAHLADTGLRLVNADVLAEELDLGPYVAARAADSVRRQLVAARESFVFETVFSDPVGGKIGFLKDAVRSGYTVVVCFIGIAGPATSDERVAIRVSQGGHDVPADKLRSRFPRTMANLKAAIRELPWVFVYDNEDLRRPFRRVAVFNHGRALAITKKPPGWLAAARR
jgi:predicted ABC-type ATPase